MNLYRYQPSDENIHRVRSLIGRSHDLTELADIPEVGKYFLTRLAIFLDHAPAFILGGETDESELINLAKRLASGYLSKFLKNEPQLPETRTHKPRQAVCSTFWDKTTWDPAENIAQTARRGLAGVEVVVDFHPFNPGKLLPFEIPSHKRRQIRKMVEETGVELSYHSPIIGPYDTASPSGKQLFFDPADNVELMMGTIDLARETGGTTVVIHLIDRERIDEMVRIISHAAGTCVVVALENYYQTGFRQDSEAFISVLEQIKRRLSPDVVEHNFGVTFDPGHYNVESEDPVIAASRVGRWCRENGIRIVRYHATVNYGPLHYFPPNYSSDVHDKVSNKGINNSVIIRLLRSMGHQFMVTGEQIRPMDDQDIDVIHTACTHPVGEYDRLVGMGARRISKLRRDDLIGEKEAGIEAYRFIAGIDGVNALREYLIYRSVQRIEKMTSETARATTLAFMNLEEDRQRLLLNSLSNLLLAVGSDYDNIGPDNIQEICDKLSGAIFESVNRYIINELFSRTRLLLPGEVLCREGEIGYEMFYIKEGRVNVLIDGIKAAELGPGEIIGEMSIFYNLPRSATIIASTPLKIGVIDRETLALVLRQRGDHARALLYRLYMTLPKRIRAMNKTYDEKYGFVSVEKGESLVRMMSSLKPFVPPIRLERMSPGEFRELFGDISYYPERSVIVEKDQDGTGIYFVEDGAVKVLDYRDGKPVLLAILGKGEIFGEMSIIDQSKTSASVISDGAYVRFLPRARFNAILSEKPSISFRVISTLCSILMDRLFMLDNLFKITKKHLSNVA